jgi:thiamine biosynthesis protein ThiI
VVVAGTGVKVRMKEPAVTLHCHVMPRMAVLFLEAVRGPGGLPVGTAGRVMLLLSGGIDSPVAGWLMMRRGCDMDAVHFEAAPYTGPEARRKVEAIARSLAAHEAAMRLFVVPFGAIQADLRDGAPGRLLVVLYRRMMMRIACRLAGRAGALALATGENLGQVASQTLQNMAAIEAASCLPVLRPLLTYDKMETVALARRIGTYDTSILPYDDCCSLFVPEHPETAANIPAVEKIEARFAIDEMVDTAVNAGEEQEITS